MTISPEVILGKSVPATVSCKISPGYPLASLKLSVKPSVEEHIAYELPAGDTPDFGLLFVEGAGSRNESYICTAEQVFSPSDDDMGKPPKDVVIKKVIHPKLPGESYKSVLSCIKT